MIKIQRKPFLLDNPEFPQTNWRTDESTYPNVYNSYRLTVDSKSAKGHATLLSIELTKLFKLMGFKKIRFLGDTNIPWLYRDHDYKPVKAALEFLVENKVAKTFAGALQLQVNELPKFLKNLYWLIRGNGIVNYVYFDDEGRNIMASLCQYGSVHFSTLNEGVDIVFNKVLEGTRFINVSNDDCRDPFSKSKSIKHRKSTY